MWTSTPYIHLASTWCHSRDNNFFFAALPLCIILYNNCEYLADHSFLQALLLSPSSPVLASLRMSVELSMSLWTGHWVMETVLISTSSTLPPMLSRSRMGDFWTSPLPVSHSMNWLVSWQAMSTISQYVVSTVGVRRGGRVSPWELLLKVCTL